jgi:hypothetical protein
MPHFDHVQPLAKKAMVIVRRIALIALNRMVFQSPCPSTPGINKNAKGII